MPTKSSRSGWNTRRPKRGATSTTKMALPNAMGNANSVDSSVTENEPAIMGSAPTVGMPFASSWCGFHVVPVKNEPRSIPSAVNVAIPRPATMATSVTTRSATSATHAPVTP